MFGLEDKNKNKNKDAFVFDLEKQMQNPQEANKLKEHLENRIQKIKNMLRTGSADSKEFEKLGIILYGLHSLHKVMERCFLAKKK